MDIKKLKQREYARKYYLKQMAINADSFKTTHAAEQARYRERKRTERPEDRKKKPRKLFVGTEDCVKKFYDLEFISRHLPGKKDYVTVKVDGTSHQIQKQVMLMTLTEAHLEFTKMFPDRPISFSKFAKLRPTNIVLMKDTPPNSCCCIYCENMKLLYEAIKPHLPSHINTIFTLLSSVACNIDNFLCMSGKCSTCSNLTATIEDFFETDLGSCSIKLFRWDKVEGFMQKMPHPGKLN